MFTHNLALPSTWKGKEGHWSEVCWKLNNILKLFYQKHWPRVLSVFLHDHSVLYDIYRVNLQSSLCLISHQVCGNDALLCLYLIGEISRDLCCGHKTVWRLQHDQNYCDHVQWTCNLVARDQDCDLLQSAAIFKVALLLHDGDKMTSLWLNGVKLATNCQLTVINLHKS